MQRSRVKLKVVLRMMMMTMMMTTMKKVSRNRQLLSHQRQKQRNMEIVKMKL